MRAGNYIPYVSEAQLARYVQHSKEGLARAGNYYGAQPSQPAKSRSDSGRAEGGGRRLERGTSRDRGHRFVVDRGSGLGRASPLQFNTTSVLYFPCKRGTRRCHRCLGESSHDLSWLCRGGSISIWNLVSVSSIPKRLIATRRPIYNPLPRSASV